MLLDVHLGQDLLVALLQVGAYFDLTLAVGQLFLDLTVRVVDDGDEHVQEDKEDKEHVGQKEDGTKDSVGSFERVKVKVAEYNAEKCVDGALECAEVLHLCAKYQVAELSESQEDNEEHDGEAEDIHGAAAQGHAQRAHGFVEARVFENLEKNVSCQIKAFHPTKTWILGLKGCELERILRKI